MLNLDNYRQEVVELEEKIQEMGASL